ncbi:hypothetical protein N7475_001695 [Penicillium sp. IBT 31633x]|nr:hypothetical protein N7475_001695 [Penicillium sp. IBT 31633x]
MGGKGASTSTSLVALGTDGKRCCISAGTIRHGPTATNLVFRVYTSHNMGAITFTLYFKGETMIRRFLLLRSPDPEPKRAAEQTKPEPNFCSLIHTIHNG